MAPEARRLLLLAVAVGSLALMLALDPFGQSQGYHRFADQRAFLGVPNFLDVSSNLAFLLVGAAGIAFSFSDRTGSLRIAWLTFFIGVALVSAGSAYYHVSPNDQTLVWDRLPITLAFMGLLAAVLGESVSERLGRLILAPAVLLGLASVLYWRGFDDVRLYYWIQLLPLLIVPVVLALFPSRYTRRWLLLLALGVYVLAKISEACDAAVFASTGQLFSGHTLKHLLAALSCLVVLAMLWSRRSAAP